ncbi:hypothetical protein [Prochlorothrix hollandica]|uniref:hypothetical protein n=1 Tax=Prochlorothrix hollandica TaxID=1223 RepID=UPI000349001C|nr:hypothetical protein [Prochlorothrix hollandica]
MNFVKPLSLQRPSLQRPSLQSLATIATPTPRWLWSLGLGLALVVPCPAQALETAADPVSPLAAITPEVAPALAPTPVAEPLVVAELYSYCEDWESTYLLAETKNFWVNICGSDYPYTYVGVDKDTGDSIRLDLSDYAEDGSWFEATNGQYVYSIIFGTTKGDFLTVTRGNQTILREYLLDWN